MSSTSSHSPARRRTAWRWGALAVLVLGLWALPDRALALALYSAAMTGLASFAFARTLVPGREPFISRLSRLERGTLPPELAIYTRRLTLLWALVLAALSITSLAAGGALPAVAYAGTVAVPALFFGEYFYRRLRYRQYPHASPWRVARGVARALSGGAAPR